MAKILETKEGSIQIDVEMQADDIKLEVPLELIQELLIVEDMDFLVPTGKLVITEHMSEYSGILEMTGNEQININLKESIGNRPTDPYSTTLSVYKPTFYPMGLDNPYKQMLEVVMVHPTIFDLVGFQVNGGYRGVQPSSIVQAILDEVQYRGESFIEPTNNDIDFITPYWTPAFAIKQLTGKSVAGDGSSGFVFFHNGKTLNYCSLNHLLRQSSRERLKYWGDPKTDYVVSDYRITPYDRFLTMMGAVGMTAGGYSFQDGEYIRQEVLPTDISKKYLGTRLPIKSEDDLDSLGRFIYTGEKSEGAIRGVATNRLSNMLEGLIRAQVTVEGILPRVHAGDMVDWIFPSKQDNTEYNAKYSGPWLVKKVSRHLANNHFRTGLILVRNAYKTSRDGVKV